VLPEQLLLQPLLPRSFLGLLEWNTCVRVKIVVTCCLCYMTGRRKWNFCNSSSATTCMHHGSNILDVTQ
jgi:hypothetical protein